MAAKPYPLCLRRIFGPSLDPGKIWYAVSNEWFYKPREFMRSDCFPIFQEDIVEVCVHDLVDRNGTQVDPSWFGSSRKKDTVLASTLFGIIGRALRRKNLTEEQVVASNQFKLVKELLNSHQFDSGMAGRLNFGGSCSRLLGPLGLETPPATPVTVADTMVSPVPYSDIKRPLEDLQKLNISVGPRLFMKRAGAISKTCLDSLRNGCNGSEIGKVFGYGLLYGPEASQKFVKDAISTALWTVSERKGVKKSFDTSLYEDLTSEYMQSLRVPDWLQLYVKLSTKMPNKSWQTLLNFLNIGRSGKAIDFGLLLTTNDIRAQKDLVFSVTKSLFNVEPLTDEVRGYGISMRMAVIWQIRQGRLHQALHSQVIEFNLKLDGRPLAGREQVSVGIVPIDLAVTTSKGLCGSQSALAVYPIAIANCAEKKSEVKKLIVRLNEEKKVLKEKGLTVDGKHYKVNFEGCISD